MKKLPDVLSSPGVVYHITDGEKLQRQVAQKGKSVGTTARFAAKTTNTPRA